MATKALNLERLCKKMLPNETLLAEQNFTESQNMKMVTKNKKNKKVTKV